MYNVRIVIIDFVQKGIVRAELQVKLCEDHWTPIKTIAKQPNKMKAQNMADSEMTKLKMRAGLDWAISLDPQIHEFESKGEE
jgi:CO dehydrogenase nickel-insertion accessory protein CooC1